MPLTGGEPIVSAESIKCALIQDGFEPGTKAFRTEMNRRWIPIGTGTYTENSDWDGERRKPADYD
jgi:hypothetical protein